MTAWHLLPDNIIVYEYSSGESYRRIGKDDSRCESLSRLILILGSAADVSR